MTIAVHSRAQETLGKNIAAIAAKELGFDANFVEFEIVPEDLRDTFTVGKIVN